MLIRAIFKTLLALTAVAAVATGHAHHGWSDYDAKTTLNLTGTFISGTSLRFGTTSSGLTPAQACEKLIPQLRDRWLRARAA